MNNYFRGFYRVCYNINIIIIIIINNVTVYIIIIYIVTIITKNIIIDTATLKLEYKIIIMAFRVNQMLG